MTISRRLLPSSGSRHLLVNIIIFAPLKGRTTHFFPYEKAPERLRALHSSADSVEPDENEC